MTGPGAAAVHARRYELTKPVVKIKTREDADLALRDIGKFEDRIAEVEIREREVIREANDRAVRETEYPLKWRAALVKELERWALKEGQKELPEGKRSLELNFGTVGFRKTPPAIAYLLKKVEHVIERLRAKRMKECIKVSERVDKEALQAYDDETLKEVGCKRVQKDEFYYEVKREEVK